MYLHRITKTTWEIKWNSAVGIPQSQLILAFWKASLQWSKGQKRDEVEFIPGLQSLAISFGVNCPEEEMQQIVFSWFEWIKWESQRGFDSAAFEGKLWQIPIVYDGEDLDYLCVELRLSKEELISLHAKAEYFIAIIGFQPGFPYLWGLPKKLSIPRRSNPRVKVKPGSVAIAAGQCGVYPKASPGGWHIVGTINPDILTQLEPGDRIQFQRSVK